MFNGRATSGCKVSRGTLGSYTWSALYMGQPVPKGGNYIGADRFNLISRAEVSAGLRWGRFWDLATSSKATADFTAGVKGAKGPDGELYLSDMVFGQWNWPKAREHICRCGISERIQIGVEAVGGFKTAYQNLRETLPQDIPVRECGADKDKLTRALPWISLAECGKVHLVRGNWVPEFLMQAEAFPDGAHDDMIDAVSGVYHMLHSHRRILVA